MSTKGPVFVQMMNDYCKSCLAHISVALILILSGCDIIGSQDGLVDLHQVSSGKVPIREFYEKVELIALDNEPGDGISMPSTLSDINITHDRLYFRTGDRRILCYSHDGSLIDILDPGCPITDFSIYNDESLDILSGYEILEYSLPELSLLRRTCLDTLVIPTSLARRAENVMMLPAYKNNNDYMCEYYFDEKYYAVSRGNMDGEDTPDIVRRMSLFRYGDELLALYPHNGQIWRCAAFFGHFLWLDFKLRKHDIMEFISAQVTDEKAYYSLRLNGECCLLIFNRENNKSNLIDTTKEGLDLPLGTIRDGVNYYCCYSNDLSRYVERDLLDMKSREVFDSAVRTNRNVIVKFYLK